MSWRASKSQALDFCFQFHPKIKSEKRKKQDSIDFIHSLKLDTIGRIDSVTAAAATETVLITQYWEREEKKVVHILKADFSLTLDEINFTSVICQSCARASDVRGFSCNRAFESFESAEKFAPDLLKEKKRKTLKVDDEKFLRQKVEQKYYFEFASASAVITEAAATTK